MMLSLGRRWVGERGSRVLLRRQRLKMSTMTQLRAERERDIQKLEEVRQRSLRGRVRGNDAGVSSFSAATYPLNAEEINILLTLVWQPFSSRRESEASLLGKGFYTIGPRGDRGRRSRTRPSRERSHGAALSTRGCADDAADGRFGESRRYTRAAHTRSSQRVHVLDPGPRYGRCALRHRRRSLRLCRDLDARVAGAARSRKSARWTARVAAVHRREDLSLGRRQLCQHGRRIREQRALSRRAQHEQRAAPKLQRPVLFGITDNGVSISPKNTDGCPVSEETSGRDFRAAARRRCSYAAAVDARKISAQERTSRSPCVFESTKVGHGDLSTAGGLLDAEIERFGDRRTASQAISRACLPSRT